MKKIIVIGSPGAGKSIFSKKLKDITNLPFGAKSRIGKQRDDLPWKEEKLDENFEKSIKEFADEKLPIIYKLLDKYKINHNIIIFKSRAEADNYIYNMEKKYEKV